MVLFYMNIKSCEWAEVNISSSPLIPMEDGSGHPYVLYFHIPFE